MPSGLPTLKTNNINKFLNRKDIKMKKFIAFSIFFSMLYAGSAFAAAQLVTVSGTVADTGPGPGVAVQMSPKVSIAYLSADGTGFTLTGANLDGTMIYGMANDDPNVYQKAKDAGTALAATDVLDDSFTVLGGSAKYGSGSGSEN
jgi:hypothetical protein